MFHVLCRPIIFYLSGKQQNKLLTLQPRIADAPSNRTFTLLSLCKIDIIISYFDYHGKDKVIFTEIKSNRKWNLHVYLKCDAFDLSNKYTSQEIHINITKGIKIRLGCYLWDYGALWSQLETRCLEPAG